jgi:hypothetical protein
MVESWDIDSFLLEGGIDVEALFLGPAGAGGGVD